MTGADLKRLGVELFGEWGWQVGLARGIGRNPAMIRRYVKLPEVPAHVAQAAKGLRYEMGPTVRRLRAKGWAIYPLQSASTPRRRRGVRPN